MFSALPSHVFANHSEWMRCVYGAVESFAAFEILVRNDFRRNARVLRHAKSCGVFLVGNDQRDFCRIIRRLRGIDQRLEI
jgi:cyanophycinase-like exopeptidase